MRTRQWVLSEEIIKLHSESAWSRGSRDFIATIPRFRFIIWLLAWEAAGIAAGVYFSWGHGLRAQVAISVAVFLVATVIAFLSVLGLLWVTAPVRQRDNARQLIGLFQEHDRFPSIIVDANSIAEMFPEERYVDLVSYPLITNQETDLAVSIQVELQIIRDGKTATRLLGQAREDAPPVPFNVPPMTTLPRFEMFWRVYFPSELFDDEMRALVEGLEYRAKIMDLISGESVEIQMPGRYP